MATLVGGSIALGTIVAEPHESATRQAHEALRTAYEKGGVTAAELLDGNWTTMFAFGPLTPPGAMAASLGHRADGVELHQVKPSESLLVFVDDRSIVGQVRLSRAEIDASCLGAGRPGGVAPESRLRIFRLPPGQPRILAAGTTRPPLVQKCLQHLPPPAGP